MFRERSGLIVWVTDARPARQLERYGTLHYISRRMNYAVMYVDADKAEDVTQTLQKLPWVLKVERSYRNEIKTEYSGGNKEHSTLPETI